MQEDKRIEEIKDILYERYINNSSWAEDLRINACNAYAMLCMAQNGTSQIISVNTGDKIG